MGEGGREGQDGPMSVRGDAGSGLARYVPGVGWLGGYQGSWLRGDLAAGLTTCAVVIPQAMAYATIAGLPVQVGLYVATVPMLVYAVAGTSRPLSVSTTSTLAALAAAAVVLRLGFMADFISAPVLAGFKAGTGLLIAAGQLGKILGVPQEGDSFFAKVGSALANLGELSWPTFALAMASIAILLGLRRWAPRSLPRPLLVVGLGIVLAVTTGLADRGVALVGAVPPGLPVLFLTPLFENLPEAPLGAVVMVAVIGLVDPAALGRIRLLRFRDFALGL